MKNLMRIFGIITVIMIISLGLIACDLVPDNDNNDPSDPNNPGSSAAYGWYGNGSASNFTINNAAQLAGFARIVNGTTGEDGPAQSNFNGKTVTLGSDINLSSFGNWTSIGSSSQRPFNGTFDGNSKTISGLFSSVGGLFRNIGENGIIKNVNLIDVSISVSGYGDGGGVVTANYGTVQNCTVTGTVYAYNAGGIAGYNYGTGTVQNCSFSGSIPSYRTSGGIVGSNQGMVLNCYSIGGVIDGGQSGGIAGSNSGIVQNCYSTNNITGWSTGVGGVVGRGSGTVQNCYSTGIISSSTSRAGGVIGVIEGVIINCVALNPSVKGTSHTNRVGPTTSNNYARSDMIMYLDNWGVRLTSDNGEDITSNEWNNANWWETTALFPSSSWEFRAGLPILKNMPTTMTQNPVVQ